MLERSFVVVGYPVAHSMSAFVQEGVAKCCHSTIKYERCQSTAENLVGLKEKALRRWDGLNITSPHKERAALFQTKSSPRASNFRAVNTLKILRQQECFGDNTDGLGFISDLMGGFVDFTNHPIFLFGSGGTAKSIALGLLSCSPQSICLVARNIRKAVDVVSEIVQQAKRCGTHISCHPFSATASSFPKIIINTTPTNPLKLWDIKGSQNKLDGLSYDIRYFPSQTEFMRDAERLGLKQMNGTRMLVSQAAECFRVWNALRLKDDIRVGIVQNVELFCSRIFPA
ncbi:shikimate 5-dehydrogenase [Candidatus Tremblaya phenacola PAVE]|nr:shikimate 5-dehydrogenase [Candidatus Tremblaya phenacola PAVE]